MDSQYLRETVGPVIKTALAEIILHGVNDPKHPEDAIDYLANFLLQSAIKDKHFNSIHKEKQRIQAIQNNLFKERKQRQSLLKDMEFDLKLAVDKRNSRIEEKEALAHIHEQQEVQEIPSDTIEQDSPSLDESSIIKESGEVLENQTENDEQPPTEQS